MIHRKPAFDSRRNCLFPQMTTLRVCRGCETGRGQWKTWHRQTVVTFPISHTGHCLIATVQINKETWLLVCVVNLVFIVILMPVCCWGLLFHRNSHLNIQRQCYIFSLRHFPLKKESRIRCFPPPSPSNSLTDNSSSLNIKHPCQ